jgi:hypothetical protein
VLRLLVAARPRIQIRGTHEEAARGNEDQLHGDAAAEIDRDFLCGRCGGRRSGLSNRWRRRGRRGGFRSRWRGRWRHCGIGGAVARIDRDFLDGR